MSKRKLDIRVGQIFTHLIVLSFEGKDKYSNFIYRCKCTNCGNEKIVKGAHLVSRNSRSCGCLMRTRSYTKGA